MAEGGGRIFGMQGGEGCRVVKDAEGERHWKPREVFPVCGLGLRALLPVCPEWPQLWCWASLHVLGCEHRARRSASCGQALSEHHWPHLKGILYCSSLQPRGLEQQAI